MKYNRTLDHLLAAVTDMKAGKQGSAARSLVAAAQSPDFEDAQRILEASNAKAFAAARKEEKPASKPISASKRLKADAEDVNEDDGAIDGGTDVDDEDMEALAGDLSELDDEADEADEADEDEADGDEVDPAEQFAKVLASMQRRSGRKAK